MKKFIALAVALVSFSALAEKHMVTISGWEDARTNTMERSLDLNWRTGDDANGHNTRSSIALNYAYAITDSVQLGALYKRWNEEGTGDTEVKRNTWGLFAIYNFAGRITDTNYVGLKYAMTKAEDKNAAGTTTQEFDANTWTVEFGHRFTLGNVWGMNFSWSPSAELAFAKTSFDTPANTDDLSSTELKLNVLKVDVIF